MSKKILVTGATDGIGLETARMLVQEGHHVLLHGRNPDKLNNIQKELSAIGTVESHIADLSNIQSVILLSEKIKEKHEFLDVLINNAGVFKTQNPITQDGLDVRFVVNTISPYLLTKKLLPLLGKSSRVINLSSAAQAPVSLNAMRGDEHLSDSSAYAQSKLAITMWSREMALTLKDKGPVIIAVNPGSLLGSKMVKEAYGISGGDIKKGASILVRTSLEDEFSNATGLYFDNDSGQLASPHPDALDLHKILELKNTLEEMLS